MKTTNNTTSIRSLAARIAFGCGLALLLVALTLPGQAQTTYSSVVLADQPIHYYQFTETALTQTAADSGTTGGQPGTFTADDTAQGILVAQPTAPARLGQAIHLDGKAGTFVDLGLFHPGESVTIEAWINLDVDAPAATYHAIVARWDGSYELDINNTDVANFVYRDANGTFGLVASNEKPARGTWQHLVGVFDNINSLATIYLNGVAGTSNILGAPLQDAGPVPDRILIGGTRSGRDASFNFKGLIAQVAIYDKALTPERILAHFNAGLPASAPDLVFAPAVILSWPSLPGFVPQSAGSLTGANPWATMGAAPQVQDGRSWVPVLVGPAGQFFRLAKP